jgi:hypothetical protein
VTTARGRRSVTINWSAVWVLPACIGLQVFTGNTSWAHTKRLQHLNNSRRSYPSNARVAVAWFALPWPHVARQADACPDQQPSICRKQLLRTACHLQWAIFMQLISCSLGTACERTIQPEHHLHNLRCRWHVGQQSTKTYHQSRGGSQASRRFWRPGELVIAACIHP